MCLNINICIDGCFRITSDQPSSTSRLYVIVVFSSTQFALKFLGCLLMLRGDKLCLRIVQDLGLSLLFFPPSHVCKWAGSYGDHLSNIIQTRVRARTLLFSNHSIKFELLNFESCYITAFSNIHRLCDSIFICTTPELIRIRLWVQKFSMI